MSGSLKYFVYVDDFDALWAMKRDESNIELMLNTTSDSDLQEADLAVVRYELPQNIIPRTATYVSTTTVRTKTITIPRRADYVALFAGTAGANQTFTDPSGEIFRLQSLNSETVRPVVFAEDTGLNDGDAT